MYGDSQYSAELNWEDAWFITISMLSIVVLVFLLGEEVMFTSTLGEGPRSCQGACVVTERCIEPIWVSLQAVSLGHQYSEFSAAAVLASNNGNVR